MRTKIGLAQRVAKIGLAPPKSVWAPKFGQRRSCPKQVTPMTNMLCFFCTLCRYWVVYHETQMHLFLKVKSTRCKNFWTQFKGYDTWILHFVIRDFGERKGKSLGKKVEVPHLLLKFCKIQKPVQRKKKAMLYSIHRGMGTPDCVRKSVGGKPEANMHVESKKDFNSAELETMKMPRSLTKVMTTARCKPEKKRL